MVSEQLHLPTAVLFVSDAKMLQRCETSIRELRTVGRYEGIVEFVTSDKNMSTVGNEHTVVSSVSSYIVDFRNHIGKDYKPTGPCPLISFKRRKGWNAYQYKVFVSMHPVWRQKYSSLLYMDCGMHTHSSFSTDLFDVAKDGRFHAHRDGLSRTSYRWYTSHNRNVPNNNFISEQQHERTPAAAGPDIMIIRWRVSLDMLCIMFLYSGDSSYFICFFSASKSRVSLRGGGDEKERQEDRRERVEERQ
jgi:hypothetical protein